MEYDIATYLVSNNYFRVKLYERKILGKTWAIYKDKDKSETSIESASPLYQAYAPTVVWKANPKREPSCRRQVVHPSQKKHHKENQLAKPETLLLIILSIVCKSNIKELHDN